MATNFRRLRDTADPRIHSVLATLASHSAHDIAQLASMVGLSSSRLSHLFKRDTGHDLRSFLAERRLQAAAQMLLRDETSVKEISYNVGYRHPASFVRAFRKRFGAAPQTYRAGFRNE